MSASNDRVAKHSRSRSAYAISEEDAEELRKLDDAYARIRSKIPQAPYYLTIPQDRPYLHHSTQDAGSCFNGLFGPHEEKWQYSTFRFREQGNDCFVLGTALDEERERKGRLSKGGEKEKEKHNFLQGTSKTKVSLSAFKNRQLNGTPSDKTEVSRPLTGNKVQGTNADNRKVSAPLGYPNGVKDPPREAQSRPKEEKNEEIRVRKSAGTDQKPNGKRNHDEFLDVRDSTNKQESGKLESMKKSRLPPTEVRKPTVHTTQPSKSTPHDLPPLLSPIRTNPITTNKYDLPPLLSPTLLLPPTIQAEVDKLRERSSSDASTPSGKRLPQAASSSQVETERSDSQEHLSVPASKKPTVAEKKAELVVKLKYGRKHKQSIERILKLPPRGASDVRRERSRDPPAEVVKSAKERPVKIIPGSKITKARDGPTLNPSENDSKTSTNTAKARPLSEKRPRPADETTAPAPPVKRHRANTSIDLKQPRTPAQATGSSPHPSNPSSAQKGSQYLTPKKESKAVSMLRSSSDQGAEALTPASSSKGSEIRNGSGPTSAPAVKRPLDPEWTQKQKQLSELGRKLKHEVEAYWKKGDKTNEEQKRLAAVRSLECIVTYIAAFAASDYSRRRVDRAVVSEQWESLLPLWDRFRTSCGPFPYLEALRLHLGIVVHSRAVVYWAQRTEQALANGSEGLNECSKKLAQMTITQRQIAMGVAEKLPLQQLMELFPETWAGRAKDKPQEWESLSSGDLGQDGPYFIHAGSETTPVQAARFGIKFLSEWVKNQGDMKDYKMKVSL